MRPSGVLELGCGCGLLAVALQLRFGRQASPACPLYATDAAVGALDLARRNLVTLTRASAQPAPL